VLLGTLRRQWPLPPRVGTPVKTMGKPQALVSFGTRGIFGRSATGIDQVAQ